MRRAIILILVLVLLVIRSLTATAQSSAPEATATMEAIRATEAARSALGMEKELPANDFTPLVTFLMGLVMAGVVMALMRSEKVMFAAEAIEASLEKAIHKFQGVNHARSSTDRQSRSRP